MPTDAYALPYPRRRLARGLVRTLGRLFLPVLFRIHIQNSENFPARGPLIMVGNHTAAMEAVLMAVYSPWQVEVLGAGDIPQETLTKLVEGFFGYIPVNRGHFDRAALTKALDVLKQDGILGIFPEGGIWEVGAMRAQTGVAWLSFHGKSPVLPVYFSDTRGALGAALRLERPILRMTVGEPLPAAHVKPGLARKARFENYARRVLAAIKSLRGTQKNEDSPATEDEHFELQVNVFDPGGIPVEHPAHLEIQHVKALAKLLHRPTILKIFRSNLNLPVEPLQNLAAQPTSEAIARAARSMLTYLDSENQYLLAYRFGPKEARSMYLGLQELLELSNWAAENRLVLCLTPVRKFHLTDQDELIVQTRQDTYEDWM